MAVSKFTGTDPFNMAGFNAKIDQVNTDITAVNNSISAVSNELTERSGEYVQVTLTTAGWSSSLTQTVTCANVVADETKQLVVAMPATANSKAYYEAGVYASAQGNQQLTFTCIAKPSVNLTVYVTAFGVVVAQ